MGLSKESRKILKQLDKEAKREQRKWNKLSEKQQKRIMKCHFAYKMRHGG